MTWMWVKEERSHQFALRIGMIESDIRLMHTLAQEVNDIDVVQSMHSAQINMLSDAFTGQTPYPTTDRTVLLLRLVMRYIWRLLGY